MALEACERPTIGEANDPLRQGAGRFRIDAHAVGRREPELEMIAMLEARAVRNEPVVRDLDAQVVLRGELAGVGGSPSGLLALTSCTPLRDGTVLL